MTNVWERFEDFGNQASAEAVATRLRLDGVPAQVERISALPGLDDGFRVTVPKDLASRARRIVGSIDTPEPESEDDPEVDSISVVFYGVALGFPLATLGLFLATDPLGFDWAWGNPIVNAIVGSLLGFPVAAIFSYVHRRRSSARI